MIGSREYKNIMTIDGLDPIPMMGIKKPKSAKLGSACTALAIPTTMPATFSNLVIAIPNGTANNIARKTAINVRYIC
jgi:hypothetical protein